MSTSAEILVIGPYDDKIADFLEYPRQYYKNVPPGMIVVSRLLQCNGRSSTIALADALGVDTYEFATFNIKRSAIKWDDLHKIYNGEEVIELKLLVDAGFSLIFLLNF